MPRDEDESQMDQATTSAQSGINRRRFLRMAGSLGALATLSGCSSSSNHETVKYPKIVSGDRVVQWMTVPKEWDRHRSYVKKIYNRVRGWLHSLDSVVGTTLVRSERTYGGHNGFRIKIIVADEASQSGSDIPGEIDGILTTTEPLPEWWGPADCSINTGNCTNRVVGDTVSGGESVGWINDGYGTATCRVTVNGKQRLLHCGHVFWDSCADAAHGVTGRVATAGNERIGTVESVSVSGDYSVINGEYGGEYVATIDDNRTYPKLIGYVTKVACEYWNTLSRKSRPCLYKMGSTTGLTTGKIIGTGMSLTIPSCTTMKHEGIQTDCDAGQGDSGGPTFLLYEGKAYLVNMVSYYYIGTHTACNGARVGINSAGISAWWIANNTDITFDSN